MNSSLFAVIHPFKSKKDYGVQIRKSAKKCYCSDERQKTVVSKAHTSSNSYALVEMHFGLYYTGVFGTNPLRISLSRAISDAI